MALIQSYGARRHGYFGPPPAFVGAPLTASTGVSAALSAVIGIGHLVWADGGTHTVDTSGSSAILMRSGTTVFSNAGTTARLGIAPVDTANGPVPRASNSADTIAFDVYWEGVGGGGGLAGGVNTKTPNNGTKTIANGEQVAIAFQLTTRAGSDQVAVQYSSATQLNTPVVTTLSGGTYSATSAKPMFEVIASDGTRGWFFDCDVVSAYSARAFNSGSSPNEYGQLMQSPLPLIAVGAYGWALTGATVDSEVHFYFDPLGTPASQRSISLDGNTLAGGAGRMWVAPFASELSIPAATPFVLAHKATTANNISTYYKTLASAADRVADPWGTNGYGVSRASGAFADANSSLDHYLIGLITLGGENGVYADWGVGL
jgi:hypothetical protein